MPNSDRVQIGRITFECLQADITNQQGMDAVVNAANAQLMPGSGVAGAIHGKAGPGLAEECRALAPIQPGEAVISGAHNLPNKHVIHCLGPVYGVDQPEDKLLADCYQYALRLAEEYSLRSIAFPAISTGAFGYPLEPAARVTFNAVQDLTFNSVQHVRFVLWSDNDFETFCRVMRDVLQ